MQTTVIISTYNQPEWLRKTLCGYSCQTVRDFEVVIADDGSGSETAAIIEEFRAASGMQVKHVWQKDVGFRKCEILNKAILASAGGYIIFADGDCVPREDLVATHLRLARPRTFLSGTIIRVSRELAEHISVDDIRTGRAFNKRWLHSMGHRPGRRGFRLMRAPRLMATLDFLTTTPSRFDGGNASVWREGLFEVNGFDAEMGYGWEDRTLGIRLQHTGYKGRQVRHRAIALHLDHDRPHRTEEGMARNKEIRDRIIRNREVRAVRGLAELLSEGNVRRAPE